ncbi:hypothetical protein [Enterovibrio nigricans]|uniref:N-acetylmuramic acid 6-phosphate etherase n=1 Tax=Enterovibrio nigricans DSM 22720 TaxID=1121868 RepID=A0A1T4VUY4_9GAMM|nr:hypothetical protein [Enterovibrio nigricans]SKA68814.1 N-acetylmuramic acid 6-phosphate etherase [Enterovibrio nigricans DSM 22720]
MGHFYIGGNIVISGLEYAREIGAKTVAITTRGHGLVCEYADLFINPDVGPEVLAGSTRMKSGSAQKMLLGMISTAVMIQLGKVHGNLMIDVKPTNEKLRVRAQNMVMQICDVKEAVAIRLLEDVGYNVRAAVLLHSLDISASEAKDIASQPYRSLNEQLDQGK